MRNKIIALMRDLYYEESTARAVLLGIGYRPSQIPVFRAAETFWPEVVLRLELGIVVNGICALLIAATLDHPGNPEAERLLAQAGCAAGREPEGARTGAIVVLCLFADPVRGSKLRIDREARLLAEIGDGGHLDVRIRFAVRVGDITGLLLREKPQILHFGGHGHRDGNLLFENDKDGTAQTVGPHQLAQAIAATRPGLLDCVVLNSCYSGGNADAFRDVSRAVAGSVTALDDDTALAFVRGFYTGLTHDQTVDKAYETGCAQVKLAHYDTSGLHFVAFPRPHR